MTTIATRLASGPGWDVEDVLCSAGPSDRPFEERHAMVCIAAVVEGSFRYQTEQGSALLVPGALLLGNAGSCFECGHEHAAGDRCLSFTFDPAVYEAVLSTVPGARRMEFDRPKLPPSADLVRIIASAEAARDDGDGAALEEAALVLAGEVASRMAGDPCPSKRMAPGDEAKVTRALRLIEERAEEELTLARIAAEAGASRYHFLRMFRAAVGMTPHQFLLRTRLHRVARRVRRSAQSISAIAYDCGFGDLSTFNRQFRRAIGVSPSQYRLVAGRQPAMRLAPRPTTI